jgi:GMP synthase (glutamine-hydrolysing)
MKTALALRHVAFEHLGTFDALLREQGFATSVIDVGREPLDASRLLDADLLAVLGGPIGVYDTDKFAWLSDELDIIERRLARNRPTLGICLGAQMIARALGARVFAGHGKEIGWSTLTLSPDGRNSPLRHLDDIAVLHWHGDTFDLPAGARCLASTALYQNQAFDHGRNTLAMQFHCEVDADDIESWLIGHISELSAAGVDINALRQASRRYGQHLKQAAASVLRDWLAGLQLA